MFTIGVVVVLAIGILAMHVIKPVTGCESASASTSEMAMTPAHGAPTDGDRAAVADHSQDLNRIGVSHSPSHSASQCTADRSRKGGILQPWGTAPVVAILAVGMTSAGHLRRGRDRPLVPNPLSIAGGLRR